MRKASAQPRNQALDYRTLVLNYLYLQSVRRKTSIAKLPPDILKALGCTVEQNGICISYIRVSEPEDKGRAQRMGRALNRIWMSKKNEDVFAYFPHKARQRPTKEMEEEQTASKSEEAEEAMMQIGLTHKDVTALGKSETTL